MQNTPKQTKLLGATVKGLGVITAVSSRLSYGYALIEDADKVNHRVPFHDLKRDEVVFPAQPQPFYTATERVAYGTWDEVHGLRAAVSVLEVAA